MRRAISKTIFQLIAVIIICLSYECTCAQSFSFLYKDAWSGWIPSSYYGTREGMIADFVSLHGHIYVDSDFGGISLEKNGVTYFKFRINYPIKKPSKKVRKEHLKNDEWYVYKGTVEYYVNDRYPTAQEIAKNNYLVKPNPRTDITPCVKRICKDATIKIQPYKKRPSCYNIMFDGIGVAIATQYFKL